MRPKGWVTPFEEEGDILDNYLARRKIDFESGADAYEAALWKMAKESPTGTYTIDSHAVNIFIEEEV